MTQRCPISLDPFTDLMHLSRRVVGPGTRSLARGEEALHAPDVMYSDLLNSPSRRWAESCPQRTTCRPLYQA